MINKEKATELDVEIESNIIAFDMALETLPDIDKKVYSLRDVINAKKQVTLDIKDIWEDIKEKN